MNRQKSEKSRAASPPSANLHLLRQERSDDRTLICPSKRVDTLGESDLYNSRFENNFWLELANLGPQFNTLATTVVRGSVMTERRST